LLSNSFAFDLCILANLTFDGPNLTFLHRHNGLAILISRESWTPCRPRTPHVAVVSRETSPPGARLFSFPACRLLSSRATFFLRAIAVSFSYSDARLGDPSPHLHRAAPVPQRRHLVRVHRREEDVEVHALLPRRIDHGDRSRRRNARQAKELRAKKKAPVRRARKFPRR